MCVGDMKLVPIAVAVEMSGARWWTWAPRRRRVWISRAEAGRKAAGLAPLPPDPDIFSRGTQRNVGAPIGLIVFGMAMGALFAVVFVLVNRRYGEKLRPRHLHADGR